MTHQPKDSLMIARVMLALIASLMGSLAWAQETIVIPQGCTPLATVHQTACNVTTLLTCGDDQRQALSYKKGNLDQVHLFDANWGLQGFLYQANAETRFDLKPGFGETFVLADLIKDGADSEDGIMLFSTRVVKNREFLLRGSYDLTGETVDLDGHVFRKGTLSREMGREGIASSWLGFEFDILVSEELDLFIEGSVVNKAEGRDDFEISQEPQSIRFEGDAGFLASMSEFGCDG
ncbi:hypothetical protein [Phaeobacter gallaeciensis]|nr:hypothetical protein [Phaeobacter gallaeciensis]